MESKDVTTAVGVEHQSVSTMNVAEEKRRLDEELESLLDKDRDYTYIEDPYNMRCLLDALGRKEVVMHKQILKKIHSYSTGEAKGESGGNTHKSSGNEAIDNLRILLSGKIASLENLNAIVEKKKTKLAAEKKIMENFEDRYHQDEEEQNQQQDEKGSKMLLGNNDDSKHEDTFIGGINDEDNNPSAGKSSNNDVHSDGKKRRKKKNNVELDKILNDLYSEAGQSSRLFARECEDFIASMHAHASLKNRVPSSLEKLCLFALYVNVKISEITKANLNVVQILQSIEHGRELTKRREQGQGKSSLINVNDDMKKEATKKRAGNEAPIRDLIDKEKSNIQRVEEDLGLFWESKNDSDDLSLGEGIEAPESGMERNDGNSFFSRCLNNDISREVEQILSAVLLVSSVRKVNHRHKRHRRHFHHNHGHPKHHRHHHHRKVYAKNKEGSMDPSPPLVYPQWLSPDLQHEQPQKFPIRTALAQLEGMMKLIMPSKLVYEEGQSFDVVRKKVLQLTGLLRTKNRHIVETRHAANRWRNKLLKLITKRDFLRGKFLKMYPSFWQELNNEDRDYLNTLANDVSLNQDFSAKLSAMREALKKRQETEDEEKSTSSTDSNS